MKPIRGLAMGTAAAWHFRGALAAFAAAVGVELASQALRGPQGAGPAGWLALLAAASWVMGLVWRERVGVARAWLCLVWLLLASLTAMLLATRRGFLFGRLEFPDGEIPLLGGVPASVPLLWWLVVGGGFLVVEGFWGDLRAGVSGYTALVAVLMAAMILPVVGSLRGYWRWQERPAPGGPLFFGMPWVALAAWFTVALGLALGLVMLGDNRSSAEERAGRQAWAPAAVLLALTAVCLGANLAAGLWLAVAFSAANAALFGVVVVGYLRTRAGKR